MKNLKKVLALVLAVSVLMGLATMASAKVAADYSDASSVKADRTEAVDVLSSLGVFQGSSGNFNPDAILTRAEAAKIICYMTMDKAEADKLIAGVAPYLDVPADHWAAGPIAHCKTQGIIAGVGNGNFDPMGQLTGLQFCKMLLTALGYDATIEGLVGSEWGNRAAAIAISDARITDGVTSAALAAPLSRQDACQLAFNTLEATMVRYETKAGSVTSGGITINLPGSTVSDRDDIPGLDYNGAGNNTDAGDTLQFCEYYFPELFRRNDSDDTPLCLASHEWEYKGVKVGSYAEDADKVMVVTDGRGDNGANAKTLREILTEKSYMNYAASKVDNINGQRTVLNGSAGNVGLNTPVYRGDVVYAYINSDNGNVERAVIARYELAKIDEVSTKLTSDETEAGAEYRIRLANLDGDRVLDSRYYDENNVAEMELNGFDPATYTEGTVLAVAAQQVAVGGTNYREIVDSYPATVLTGKPTGVNNADDGFIRISGQKYDFADSMCYNSGAASLLTGGPTGVKVADGNSAYNLNDEYKVYTTKENYVLGVEALAEASLDDVRYVTGIHTVESSFGGTAWYAQTVSMDGKVEDVQIEKATKEAIEKRVRTVTGNPGFTFVDDGVTRTMQPEAAGFYLINDKSYKKNNSAAFGTVADDQDGKNGKMSLIWIGTGANNVTNDDDVDYSDPRHSEPQVKEYNPFRVNTTDGSTAQKLAYTDNKLKVNGGGGTYYIGSETKFVTIEDDNQDKFLTGDLTVKTGTGSARADAGTKVAVLTDDDNTDEPLAVVLVANYDKTSTGTDTNAAVGSANLVYLSGEDVESTGDDLWSVTAYFMEDQGENKAGEKTTIICDKDTRGFYTFTASGSGDSLTYELSEADKDVNGAIAPSTDTDGTGVVDYDDETGGVQDATITKVTNSNYVDGTGWSENTLNGTKFEFKDLKIASGVNPVWVGLSAANLTAAAWDGGENGKPANTAANFWDAGDIDSVKAMRDCINLGGNQSNRLLADLYIDDGKILFIAVLGWDAA